MKQKQTIAYVAHDVGGLGGMERHLEEVITRLKHDYHVVIVSASLNMKNKEGIKWIRIPVPSRPAPLKMILFAILATIRISFLNRDILHTTGAIVWNKADFSTVHLCHHGFLKSTGNTRAKLNQSFFKKWNSRIATRYALWMEKIIYNPARTRKLIGVSNRTRTELIESFPYKGSDIITIPNGVDFTRFKPVNRGRKLSLRQEHDLREKGRYLLFMGGDWPLKGLDFVIDAFKQLAPLYPDIHLLIVGKGDPKPYLAQLEVHEQERVRFTGRQSKPEEWMAVSDLFIFPSSYETFSLVVHEAAATGLPIVATKVGGVEDLLEHGSNGLIVTRNGEDIRQAIETLLIDAETSANMGKRVREDVSSLTWDSTYERMINQYKKRLVDRHGNGRERLEHIHN